MACPSSRSSVNYKVRSISLPCRSHPATVKVEEELNKLKALEASSAPTAETICRSLTRLQELYHFLDDLLSLPLTQQALSQHKHEKWLDGLLDESVRLLDICRSARDVMFQIKEHVTDLQSAIRRRKGDMSIESSVAKYTSFRKKMKKDANRWIAALKQVDDKMMTCSQLFELEQHQLISVIRVLSEVSVVSISIFQSLLLFFTVPVLRQKPSKWSVVSKLMMHKRKVACEDQFDNVNELQTVDAALHALCTSGPSEGDKKQLARNRLEALEDCTKGIEDGFECMFRCLIRTRGCLLDIGLH